MPFHPVPSAAAEAALAGARPLSPWLDDARRPAPLPPLRGAARADLAVVGGGYTGLWTALRAKERDPGRDVLLLEGASTGWAASGRNGGFVSASLTHGRSNGERHLPREVDRLDELGQENLDAFEETVARYGWDCAWERTGSLTLATEPHQVEELRGEEGFLDTAAVQAEVHSPTYLAGVWNRRDTALVNPAQLVWELRRTCLELGVRIVEGTPVRRLSPTGPAVRLHTDGGVVSAGAVALGTNAFPSLLKRYRLHTVPVYDYVLMTEPLTPEQRRSVGWANRQGLDDMNNQFHYYRLTADDRVLFGGYDAIYHYGRSLSAAHDQRTESFRTLAAHFGQTFPQLDGVRFTHAWGGAIDTCTRFFPFFGTAARGRIASVAGFTGLGVGMTRFAADVLLDLLGSESTERTELELVRSTPLPFPPEPLAWAGITLTTKALVRADRREGRRGPWLAALDAAGVGFDS